MELHDQRNQSPTLVCRSESTQVVVHRQGGLAWIQRVGSRCSINRGKNGVTAQRILIPLSILIGILAGPVGLFAASGQSGSQYTPTFPGGLIAWLVCNGRKRNQIGGWLLFFFWQLYSGLIISAVLFAANIQSYVPENFTTTQQYALFILSTIPVFTIFLVQLAVGTVLLSARTWDVLKLLRWLIGAEVVASSVSTIIDANYFPDNVGLNFLTLIPQILWLAYFFRSARVKHVFQIHDWEIAVNSIYPVKPKLAT
jgi:hypothetical protein